MKYTDVFERNPVTDAMILEIVLDNYDDYYHEWDNAKYRMRDMHPDLYKFIEECSDQIPVKEKLEIRFKIADEQRDLEREKTIRGSYSNYFNSNILAQVQRLRRSWLTVAKSLVFGIILLWASSFLSTFPLPKNFLISLLLQGLLIGGWVFVWEAIYTTAYSLHEERSSYKKLIRMKTAEIVFP